MQPVPCWWGRGGGGRSWPWCGVSVCRDSLEFFCEEDLPGTALPPGPSWPSWEVCGHTAHLSTQLESLVCLPLDICLRRHLFMLNMSSRLCPTPSRPTGLVLGPPLVCLSPPPSPAGRAVPVLLRCKLAFRYSESRSFIPGRNRIAHWRGVSVRPLRSPGAPGRGAVFRRHCPVSPTAEFCMF